MNPQLLQSIMQVVALVGGIILFVLDKPEGAVAVMGAGNAIAATSAGLSASRKASS